LIIPTPEKPSDSFSQEFPPVGTLAQINLNIAPQTDPETFINSLRGVQFQGLVRIKLTNLEKSNELHLGEYQELMENKLSEELLEELTEKFVRYLPDILEKTRLNSVDKLHATMMRGNLGSLIDLVVQNSREIDPLTKLKLLASLDLRKRLEILISLPDRQKIDKEIEDRTREKMKDENEKYYLQKN